LRQEKSERDPRAAARRTGKHPARAGVVSWRCRGQAAARISARISSDRRRDCLRVCRLVCRAVRNHFAAWRPAHRRRPGGRAEAFARL